VLSTFPRCAKAAKAARAASFPSVWCGHIEKRLKISPFSEEKLKTTSHEIDIFWSKMTFFGNV
jgi:hypothetical protein